MTCEELSPEYTAYALGILDDPERAEITAHLQGQCPKCVPGVASALATVSAMSGAAALAEPPRNLRRRVIAMVQPASRRSWSSILLPWGLAAALAVALVSVALQNRRRDPEIAKLRDAMAILNDPLAKDIAFGPGKPSKGRVFVSPRGVVFIAASLPALAPGKTFEMWIIPAGGQPIPAGTFHSQPDASAVYVRSGPLEATPAAIAITIEPEGGSPAPTTTPFIVAALT